MALSALSFLKVLSRKRHCEVPLLHSLLGEEREKQNRWNVWKPFPHSSIDFKSAQVKEALLVYLVPSGRVFRVDWEKGNHCGFRHQSAVVLSREPHCNRTHNRAITIKNIGTCDGTGNHITNSSSEQIILLSYCILAFFLTPWPIRWQAGEKPTWRTERWWNIGLVRERYDILHHF